jgi:hypothetical protein
LQDWLKLAIQFQKLVQNAADGSLQFHTFFNPMFSSMHMAAKNNATTKYLVIEENFLLATIHVAAMKSIPFAKGTFLQICLLYHLGMFFSSSLISIHADSSI